MESCAVALVTAVPVTKVTRSQDESPLPDDEPVLDARSPEVMTGDGRAPDDGAGAFDGTEGATCVGRFCCQHVDLDPPADVDETL